MSDQTGTMAESLKGLIAKIDEEIEFLTQSRDSLQRLGERYTTEEPRRSRKTASPKPTRVAKPKSETKPEPKPETKPERSQRGKPRTYVTVKDIHTVLTLAADPLTPFKLRELLRENCNVQVSEAAIKQVLEKSEGKVFWDNGGRWALIQTED